MKPCCVKISQLAIRLSEAPVSPRELIDLTNQVLTILNDQIQRNPRALDEKIAEYVFFPLYHIFRQIDLFPMILIEKCVKCLNILIVHGWQSKISPKLVQQILGLLTFIIDGVPGSKNKREVPEETALEAFRALTALLQATSQSATAAGGLAEPDAIPALGHGITVMLDGVANGATDLVQNEALRALQGVYSSMRDHAALATFLPGTVSSLTKILSTPAHYKKTVLAQCLKTTSMVLTRVLGDLQTRAILATAASQETEEADKNKLLSPAWLKATVSQVKLALSNMMKLRTHDASEIKDALRSLCVKLLDECSTTLLDCSQFLVETAMILDTGGSETSFTETSLRDLVNIYPELGEKAKTAVYNWMLSLPRVMQSSDEDVKRIAIHNLSKGIGLLQDLGIESSTLQDSISSTLRDSVVSLMSSSKSPANVLRTDAELGDTSVILASHDTEYEPIILAHARQREVRTEMAGLLSVIGSHTGPSKLAANMLEHVQESVSVNQIAAFWLCFELIKATHASSAVDGSEFLDLSEFGNSSDDIDVILNDLYSFSVQVLETYSENISMDWRLEALALEVTEYAAKRSGEDFCPELIDVLFPIVTFLGSENHHLREYAIVTLNGMAQACQYGSVSELIIANVDYMVNSVALRLNTLDISPATTQVLTVMIRLAGPRLVPFLDDVVESIFAALENYHGYPAFVESLFSVLKELVDQAVRSDILLLEGQKQLTPDHRNKPPQNEGIDDLLSFLDRREERRKRNEEEAKSCQAGGHPTAPWKEGNEEGDDQMEDPLPEKEKPPNSVTYDLLLRITTLTQHYLTSPTPKLRRSLLNLISTASPALAADEDAFLPLVNAIWPVVMSRLYDEETFIAVEACHALSALCAAAGDFIASRFKTEWADGLDVWCRKAKQRVLSSTLQSTPQPKRSGALGSGDQILIPTSTGELVKATSKSENYGSLGQHASPVRLWEAVVKLLTSMVSHVKMSEDMFEEILSLLVEVLERSSEVRKALESVNADAVWLVRYERGCVEWVEAPKMDGVQFAQMSILT